MTAFAWFSPASGDQGVRKAGCLFRVVGIVGGGYGGRVMADRFVDGGGGNVVFGGEGQELPLFEFPVLLAGIIEGRVTLT